MIKTKITTCDKITQELIELIICNGWLVGTRLPSDRSLAEHFSVNRQTIHRAMMVLVENKIVERRRGAGTFVIAGRELLNKSEKFTSQKENTDELCIGIISSMGGGTFNSSLLDSFQVISNEKSLTLYVSKLHGTPGPELIKCAMSLKRSGCKAIVLSLSNHNEWSVWIQALLEVEGIPPIIMASLIEGMEDYHFNLGRGVYDKKVHLSAEVLLVCDYFKELGYGRIAFYGPLEPKNVTLVNRQMTYCAKMAREEMNMEVGLVLDVEKDTELLIRRWAKAKETIGVICYDDDFAVLFINAVHKSGYRVPEDFAVIGYNDTTLGAKMQPALTSVMFDYETFTRNILQACLARINMKDIPYAKDMRINITVRNSCGGRLLHGDKIEAISDNICHRYTD